MAKVNKIFPSFYNGVSEQPPELMLDTNCKDMINCIPSVVLGLKKRPPVVYKAMVEGTLFHTYDRGEDNEEYNFYLTGNYDAPIKAYNKAGTELTVELTVGEETAIKDYLNGLNIKGLTVQDRTWLYNTDTTITIDTSTTSQLAPYYDREAYYWLKRSSGDDLNPYRYAVYIDDIIFEAISDESDTAASSLSNKINAISSGLPDYIRAVAIGSILKIYMASIYAPGFRFKQGYTSATLLTAKTSTNSYVRIKDPDGVIYGKNVTEYEASEKLITQGWLLWCTIDGVTDWYNLADESPTIFGVPYYSNNSQALSNTAPDFVYMELFTRDLSTDDFKFSSWDSWGNSASEGWKQSVNKVTDLPKDMAFDNVYVEITGDDNSNFTTYYVKWNGSSWEECLDPLANRGLLSNMPIAMDRTGTGVFTVSLLEWSPPRTGNIDNNPDPSFVDYKIESLFFHKNRLGIASTDSVVLSKSASYGDFYVKTVVDILDTDPIDVAIASNKASRIYYVKPFNNSLYIFTKDSQFELTGEGFLSPKTVSINNVTNYPMAIDVEPKVINNSLFFISTTGNKQQLREYIKNDKLTVEGVDLNIATPNYLSVPITNILVNGVLGYVICTTATNLVYVYNYKETGGGERPQSGWNKWLLLDGLTTIGDFHYSILDAMVVVVCTTADGTLYHGLYLDNVATDDKVDITFNDVEIPYTSKVELPDFLPHIKGIGSPKDKILLKKIAIEGSGNFSASLYRKDYDRTYSKAYNDSSMKDLDFHVSSKVGNVDIFIEDSTSDDFTITSITMEGLYSPTSKEIK